MSVAEKISVTIPSDALRALRESVDAGEYGSLSEAVQDSVRLWQRQRQTDCQLIDALRARIRRSIDDPRADLSSEDVAARLDRLFDEAEPSSRA